MCWKVLKELFESITGTEEDVTPRRSRRKDDRDFRLMTLLCITILMGLLSPANCTKAPGDSISVASSTASADNASVRGLQPQMPTKTQAISKANSAAINAGLADQTSNLDLNSLSTSKSNAKAVNNSQAKSVANSGAGSVGVALDNSSAKVDSTSNAGSNALASNGGNANSKANSSSIGSAAAYHNSNVGAQSKSNVNAQAVAAGNQQWNYNTPVDSSYSLPSDNFVYLGNPLDPNFTSQSDVYIQKNGPLLSDNTAGKQTTSELDDTVYTTWADVYYNRKPDSYNYYKMQPSPVVTEFNNFQLSAVDPNTDPTQELQALQLQAPTYKTALGTAGNIAIDWYYNNFVAVDVGMGPQGEMYAAGVDGCLYEYDLLKNTWHKLTGDFDLRNIVRVAVAYDGTPYVVTACGDTYYLNCEHKWEKLPGCARDIGAGMGGEIYKIGCERRSDGYRIYRLICKYDCKKCSRPPCLRFRKKCGTCYTHESYNDRKCNWFNIDGGGVRISVHSDGNPVVISDKGEILYYDGTDYINVPNTRAIDLSVSNEGLIFYVGHDYGIYALKPNGGSSNYTSNLSYVQLLGQSGIAVSSGPYSRPIIVGSEYKVFSSFTAPGHGYGY